MTGIIYCNKLEAGIEQFKKITDDYKKIGIEIAGKIKTTSSTVDVTLTNGDYWMVVKASESAKGRSCNVAYIDRMIDEKLVDEVIMPTIKAAPYQAYRYYNWSNW